MLATIFSAATATFLRLAATFIFAVTHRATAFGAWGESILIVHTLIINNDTALNKKT